MRYTTMSSDSFFTTFSNRTSLICLHFEEREDPAWRMTPTFDFSMFLLTFLFVKEFRKGIMSSMIELNEKIKKEFFSWKTWFFHWKWSRIRKNREWPLNVRNAVLFPSAVFSTFSWFSSDHCSFLIFLIYSHFSSCWLPLSRISRHQYYEGGLWDLSLDGDQFLLCPQMLIATIE